MPKSSSSLSTYTTMMRVNSKGRPYAKDLYDVFSALLIQQPLSDHRSLFRTYPFTFTTDEAVESLSQLKFTHLVSTPNPLDPSQPLLTRTTTTFSMSRDMAKILGQHFLTARLIENATDPQNRLMKDRGIWQPTPKGKFMIQHFSQRARVPMHHMHTSLGKIPQFQIVLFERLLDDDQLSFSRPNMVQAFKVMMESLPTNNLMIDEVCGMDNKIIESYKNTFFGYQCFEWIMEYTSIVSTEEAESIAAEFVLYGWIQQVFDKSDKEQSKRDKSSVFKTGKKTRYYLTEKGRSILEVIPPVPVVVQPGSTTGTIKSPRSRTHSSTSSSNSSVRTNHSGGKKRPNVITVKEEHSNRLLPTTSESNFNGIQLAPKAIITRKKSIANRKDKEEEEDDDDDADDEESESIAKDSVLQLDNSSCDFGFSSGSSTTSSNLTPNYPPVTMTTTKGYDTQTYIHSSPLHDQLERLKVAVNPPPIVYTSEPINGSQNSRLQEILNDPLIRMYFRQFLKSNFCEENINFWVDYTALVKKINPDDITEEEKEETFEKISSLSRSMCYSILNHCHVIYTTYFCPEHAPSELNIDHGLRYDIIQYMQDVFVPPAKINNKTGGSCSVDAPFGSISVSSHGLMTSSVARPGAGLNLGLKNVLKDDIQESPQDCLIKIIQLFDMTNRQVCKTMAQDSVPRFIRTDQYRDLMRNYYLQQHPMSDLEEEDEEE